MKPPKQPPNLPEGFIPVQDKPEPVYWTILLVLGILVHLLNAILTEPADITLYIGKTIGTIFVSLFFLQIYRLIARKKDYFTRKYISIFLYVGLILYIFFKNMGKY